MLLLSWENPSGCGLHWQITFNQCISGEEAICPTALHHRPIDSPATACPSLSPAPSVRYFLLCHSLCLFEYKPFYSALVCSVFLSISDLLWPFLALSLPHSCYPQWDWLRMGGLVQQFPMTAVSLSWEDWTPVSVKFMWIEEVGVMQLLTLLLALGGQLPWQYDLCTSTSSFSFAHKLRRLSLVRLCFQFTSELQTGVKTVYWMF